MLPNTQTQTVHIDNGVTQEFLMRMSDNAADAAFVLQTMTDLYSIKPLAVIREVSTNGWDSHIAAGQTRSIEVTLPVEGNNPEFIVRDYGVGLDAVDMDTIFVQFGKSTKRTSATATGMLGFGSKAPLTYCLSFTVIGVKDGIKTIAVVSRNETGLGSMKVLGTPSPTDEPNGVTVKVPVSNVTEFNTYAEGFYRFWRDGNVLIRHGEDGEFAAPTVIESVMDLDDRTIVLPKTAYRDYGPSYVVMGNVPYKFDTPNDLPATVTWVDVGEVNFVPNREALLYDDRTKATIEAIKQKVRDLIEAIIAFEVDGAPSTYARYRKILELKEVLPRRYRHPSLALDSHALDIQHRPRTNQYGHAIYVEPEKYAWLVQHGTAYRHDDIDTVWIANDNVAWVTGFPFKSVSPVHKAKLMHNGLTGMVVLIPDTATLKLDGFPGRPWDTLADVPKQTRVKEIFTQPRTKTLYTFREEAHERAWEVYEGDKQVLYVNSTRYTGTDTSANTIAIDLSRAYPDAVVAVIHEGQVDRFTRLHPEAQPWRDFVKADIAKLVRKVRKSDRAYLNATAGQREFARLYGPVADQIKDPQLKAMCKLRKDNLSESAQRLLRISSTLGNQFPGDSDDPVIAKVKGLTYRYGYRDMSLGATIEHRYPLIAEHGWSTVSPSEWLIYLNGKYREAKKAERAALSADDTADDTADAA